MKKAANNRLKFSLTGGTIIVLLTMVSMLLANAQAGVPKAATDGIDEIVVIGTDGHVYAYDYTGELIFKSLEAGWNHVATADLNGDGDAEIIAVSFNSIKVYDPQVDGSPFQFSATYSGSAGQFIKVAAGNLIKSDATPEIALLRSVGDGTGRIIIYDPPNANAIVDESFLTEWNNFAVGDYDGDGDDDFALTHWNTANPDGYKNLMELRKGHDPKQRLEGSENNFQKSDSQWFDIATGNFIGTNGNRVEWVGSQNLGDNIIAQHWENEKIKKIWGKSNPYNLLATADFRKAGLDQVVMLRNVTGNSTSLRFVNYDGQTWLNLTGLGTGWLELGAGNVDTDSIYREAVLVRGDLIRVYRLPQLNTVTSFDCDTESECLEITGSFKAALAIGDLGVDLELEKLEPYAVEPAHINRGVGQNEEVPPAKIVIRGEQAVDTPLTWQAIPLPRDGARAVQDAVAANPDLSITRLPSGIQYSTATRTSQLPNIPWITLESYSGTTPATVTVSFSDTYAGSPVFEPGAYQATILVWQTDIADDRFRFADVTLIVGIDNIYLPLLLK